MKDENYNRDYEILQNLKESFMKKFNENGFKSTDKFDKNAWFLKNKINCFIQTEGFTPTGGNKNEMLDILEKISSNGANLNKLEVKVDDFINEISKVIFEYHNHKIKIEENLCQIGLKEKIEKIEKNKKVKYINNQRNNKLKIIDFENNEDSKKVKVEFFFSAINGLTEGEYKLTINYKLDSNDDYFTNKKATIFFINKSSKNLEKLIKIEFMIDDKNEEYYDKKFFPIKEYYFEIEKNSKLIFNTDFVSFDPFILQYIDKINDFSEFKVIDKEDFQLDNERENTKYSINYNIIATFDTSIKEDILKKTIDYYNNLIKGIENLNNNIIMLKSYFDEKFITEIDEILKGTVTRSLESCACSNCSIF